MAGIYETEPREVTAGYLEYVTRGWTDEIGVPDPLTATDEQISEVRQHVDHLRSKGKIVREFGPARDRHEAWRVYSMDFDKFFELDRETGNGFED